MTVSVAIFCRHKILTFIKLMHTIFGCQSEDVDTVRYTVLKRKLREFSLKNTMHARMLSCKHSCLLIICFVDCAFCPLVLFVCDVMFSFGQRGMAVADWPEVKW